MAYREQPNIWIQIISLRVNKDAAFLTRWSLFLSKQPIGCIIELLIPQWWSSTSDSRQVRKQAENPIEKQNQAGFWCPDDTDDITEGIFLLLWALVDFEEVKEEI